MVQQGRTSVVASRLKVVVQDDLRLAHISHTCKSDRAAGDGSDQSAGVQNNVSRSVYERLVHPLAARGLDGTQNIRPAAGVVGEGGPLSRLNVRGRAGRPGGSCFQVGKQLGALLLQRSDLSSELLQVAVDPRQLGPRAPLAMVPIVVGAVHELLDLAPQEPQPGIAVDDADSVLKLTGVDRRDDLVLGQPELLACCLVAERCALPAPLFLHGARPSISRGLHRAAKRNAIWPMSDSGHVSPAPGVRGYGSPGLMLMFWAPRRIDGRVGYRRVMSGEFEVICEVEPATRSDLMHVRHQIGVLSKVAKGFLIPDNHLGRATVSSVAVAREVSQIGGHPIACLNASDRNLRGFRRDLLTAAAYGVDEFLFVYGDRPSGVRSGDLSVRAMMSEAKSFPVGHAGATGRFRVGVTSDLVPLRHGSRGRTSCLCRWGSRLTDCWNGVPPLSSPAASCWG